LDTASFDDYGNLHVPVLRFFLVAAGQCPPSMPFLLNAIAIRPE